MSSRFSCRFPFGAQVLNERQCRFSLWAPGAKHVLVRINGRNPVAMHAEKGGCYTSVAEARDGDSYVYQVQCRDGSEIIVPDPASRRQQKDVHGSSVVVNPLTYDWQHPSWMGRPWQEMVIYEMHAGCYGGFAAMEKALPALHAIGITAIELMPVADFSGERNWGYDGVLPYAPARAYGTPDELRHFIDYAHELGLCVYLDVVYNHFGPEGNYLHNYAPDFFDSRKDSPWGATIDFSQRPVREFFISNALYWLMEYRFDGLRFDAVHAISDPSWLEEAASRIRKAVERGRHVHLMLENERNISEHLEEAFDAQWNDDIHNVLHVLLTGENEDYYANYEQEPAEKLARALGEGFVYQGEAAPSQDGRLRGTPSAHLPPCRFIFFLQNHDQVGNRAFGERLRMLAATEALRAAVVLQLLCPQIPLLFMGEEEGATEPFFFFTDFSGELADAVREGRRQEFRRFSQFGDSIPDPNDRQTFLSSAAAVRKTAEPGTASRDPETAAWQKLYQELLEVRHRVIIPALPGTVSLGSGAVGCGSVIARWALGNGSELTIAVNLGSGAANAEAIAAPLLYESRAGAGEAASRGRLLPASSAAFLSDPSEAGWVRPESEPRPGER